MIQSFIDTPIALTSNSASISFQRDCIRTGSCACNNCQSWLCHSEGSANYDIVRGGRYTIDFTAVVSSATAGDVALQLYNNGEPIPGSLLVATLPAADDFATVSVSKDIVVCCNGNANISVRAVPSVPTPSVPTTPIVTQIPILVSANLKLNRKC